MKVIIVGAHGEAKELINRISSGWSISVIDLDQDKLQTHITFRNFMNDYHVISKIHCLVHIKNALITFYNNVELSCEHLAMFQFKL